MHQRINENVQAGGVASTPTGGGRAYHSFEAVAADAGSLRPPEDLDAVLASRGLVREIEVHGATPRSAPELIASSGNLDSSPLLRPLQRAYAAQRHPSRDPQTVGVLPQPTISPLLAARAAFADATLDNRMVMHEPAALIS